MSDRFWNISSSTVTTICSSEVRIAAQAYNMTLNVKLKTTFLSLLLYHYGGLDVVKLVFS